MDTTNESQISKPSEPVLCKAGCGFFGSGATGGLCSKCWRDNMKKEEAAVCPPAQTTETETTPAPTAAAVESTTPMDVDTNATTTTIKKKKKKKSYKSLMAGMMKTEQPRDVEKEKEQLRSVTGGGAFSKIDKI